MDARDAISLWGLLPHPEGGHYRETYRSSLSLTPPGGIDPRALATSIRYLLEPGARSAWHRVNG